MNKIGSFVFILLLSCSFAVFAGGKDTVIVLKESLFHDKTDVDLTVGAGRMDLYLSSLKDKSVAIVGNQTSVVGKSHLVDTLLRLGVHVKTVFAPEHGFRGTADAGEHVDNGKDQKTGLPLISLYGEHLKPSKEDLSGVDVVIFDIQDVGARFYTYISTLHYVMEACAEYGKQLIVLDRPNPNGFYVDGPILESAFSSFVGLDPLPIVHGLTVGEYAGMVNGEHWLKGGLQCKLQVVPVKNYSHKDLYQLPVKPSPNLPNMTSVYLYPTLCLFEGTVVSVGRGTEHPFQVIGFPGVKSSTYEFTPKSMPGATAPMYAGQLCKGFDIGRFGEMYIKNARSLYLFWLKGMYAQAPDKAKFFTDFFTKLAGTESLKAQLIAGASEERISKSWKAGLDQYKLMRKKYLLYEDFE